MTDFWNLFPLLPCFSYKRNNHSDLRSYSSEHFLREELMREWGIITLYYKWRHNEMKFRFWHKMTAIFGFLDEKCIEMEIFIITSWLFRIMTSLKLCQLYRDLYGKMAFWPQWRHQLGAANLWQATVAEENQLLSCDFFCSSGFFRYFLPLWYWKWWQFPFK